MHWLSPTSRATELSTRSTCTPGCTPTSFHYSYRKTHSSRIHPLAPWLVVQTLLRQTLRCVSVYFVVVLLEQAADSVQADDVLVGCAPQLCYVDDCNSYSTNEVAINWGSALAWVASWAADQ